MIIDRLIAIDRVSIDSSIIRHTFSACSTLPYVVARTDSRISSIETRSRLSSAVRLARKKSRFFVLQTFVEKRTRSKKSKIPVLLVKNQSRRMETHRFVRVFDHEGKCLRGWETVRGTSIVLLNTERANDDLEQRSR